MVAMIVTYEDAMKSINFEVTLLYCNTTTTNYI